MTMLVEYKPFEPGLYHTDIADWGMSYVFCRALGPQARVLVDLGHHLPGTNIEHIVAFLLDEKLLGGFHFGLGFLRGAAIDPGLAYAVAVVLGLVAAALLPVGRARG